MYILYNNLFTYVHAYAHLYIPMYACRYILHLHVCMYLRTHCNETYYTYTYIHVHMHMYSMYITFYVKSPRKSNMYIHIQTVVFASETEKFFIKLIYLLMYVCMYNKSAKTIFKFRQFKCHISFGLLFSMFLSH